MLFVVVAKIAAFISWEIQKMMLLRRGTGGQTMAKYIEREALLASLCQGNYPWADFNDAIEIVENQQTADVSAVIHGQWIEYPRAYYFKCSNCKYTVPYKKAVLIGGKREYNYCPHCGARMDVKKEG